MVNAQSASSCGGVAGGPIKTSKMSADMDGVVSAVGCDMIDVVEVLRLLDGCRCFGGAGEASSELETDLWGGSCGWTIGLELRLGFGFFLEPFPFSITTTSLSLSWGG